MKKAFVWLDEHGVSYEFYDYKKRGADEAVLKAAIDQHGWETVINRRGTTWRKLPEEVKNMMDKGAAIKAALDNPSLIKRPLLVKNGQIHLGFKEQEYKALFS